MFHEFIRSHSCLVIVFILLKNKPQLINFEILRRLNKLLNYNNISKKFLSIILISYN